MHNIDIVNEEVASAIVEDNEKTPKEYVTLDGWLEEANKPVPWYKNCFYVLFYRIPYKIEGWWDNRVDEKERGKKGYCRRDVWNLYVYLSKVIGGSTRDLANDLHGYPPDVEEEEWPVILKKISSAFSRVADAEEKGEYLTIKERANLDEAFDLMKKHFLYLWD
jgi:hypothetical protein